MLARVVRHGRQRRPSAGEPAGSPTLNGARSAGGRNAGGATSDALRLRLAGRLARAQPRDQIRDVRQLLLQIALVTLEPLEDVVTVIPPPAEAAMVSASVMHVHLPS